MAVSLVGDRRRWSWSVKNSVKFLWSSQKAMFVKHAVSPSGGTKNILLHIIAALTGASGPSWSLVNKNEWHSVVKHSAALRIVFLAASLAEQYRSWTMIIVQRISSRIFSEVPVKMPIKLSPQSDDCRSERQLDKHLHRKVFEKKRSLRVAFDFSWWHSLRTRSSQRYSCSSLEVYGQVCRRVSRKVCYEICFVSSVWPAF